MPRLGACMSLAQGRQHRGRILRSEGYAVAHRVLDLNRGYRCGNVIKIALRVRLFEIDGRWKLFVLHGDERGGPTCRAASALRMPDLRLQRRHWDFIRVAVQRQFERARLDTVVEFRRSPVEIHVIDVPRTDAGFLESQLNGAGRFFTTLLQTHSMEGFAGRAIAGNLSVDVRAARLGSLVLLHHEHPRAFS